MPETEHTPNRNIPYPTNKDFVPEGPANMAAIAGAVDAANTGEVDFLQAGVVQASDWSFVAGMENSATCALNSTGATGGVAWLPSAAIGLVRSVTATAALKALKPGSLPGPGKYLTVGFELTPATWGAAATVSVVSGVEQATQKLAEENSPAVTAGKARVRDVVILNTAGVYSIVSQTERRARSTAGLKLAFTEQAGSYSAKAGDFVFATGTGSTITVPVTANSLTHVFYAQGSGELTVKAASGIIVGDFTSAASCKLLANQHLLLIGDGTNVRIIAGEPQREQKYSTANYTKAECEAGVTPSATRPAYVICEQPIHTIGGHPLLATGMAAKAPVYVPAGQSWTAIPGGTIEATTILL